MFQSVFNGLSGQEKGEIEFHVNHKDKREIELHMNHEEKREIELHINHDEKKEIELPINHDTSPSSLHASLPLLNLETTIPETKVVSLDGASMTVEQLLDSSLLQNAVMIEDQGGVTSTQSFNSNYASLSVIEEGLTFDDDDIFQCGKCKSQFSSLRSFLLHKRNRCSVSKVKSGSTQVSECGSLDVVCDSNTGSPLDQQVTSSMNPEDQEEQCVAKYECSTSMTASVNQRELFDLTLDPAGQVFKLRENVEMTAVEGAIEGVASHKETTDLFATTIPLPVDDGSPGTIVTEVIAANSTPTPLDGMESLKKDGIDSSVFRVAKQEEGSAHMLFHGHLAKVPSPPKADELSSDRVKHRCSFCKKAFSKNFDLQQHIRSHTGEKPFQCIVCGRAFAQKSNVKKHMVTHRVWPQDWVSNTLPKNPIKKVLPESLPPGESSDKEGLKSEVIVDDSYVCPFCEVAFSSYLALRSHMKRHNDQKVYRCIQRKCEGTFSALDAFLDHIRIHAKEDLQYRCHTCSKVFRSLHSLGYHHQFEHSIYPWPKKSGPSYFRCTKCMNKYASAEALEHHLRVSKHHFPCGQCPRVFFSERLLRTHLRVHGNAALFTCATCCKTFKTEHSLKMHQLIHTDERPFECQTCTLAFNRKDQLKRHLLVHEAKQYKCLYSSTLGCTREFRRNDKLRLHLLTHAHSGLKKRKATTARSGKAKQVKTEDLSDEKAPADFAPADEDGHQSALGPGANVLPRGAPHCRVPPPPIPDGSPVEGGEPPTKIRVKKHSGALLRKAPSQRGMEVGLEAALEVTTSKVGPETGAEAPSITVCPEEPPVEGESLRHEEFIVSYGADPSQKGRSQHEVGIIYIPFSLPQETDPTHEGEDSRLTPGPANQPLESAILLPSPYQPQVRPCVPEEVIRLQEGGSFFVGGDEAFVTASSIWNI